MNNNIAPASRLILAADGEHPLGMAETLRGTGIVIKENASLRDGGYTRMSRVRKLGLDYFADLKLNDIEATLRRDGQRLAEYKPAFVTAMCNAPFKALVALKRELPETKVLAVSVLTDVTEQECQEMYGRNIADQVEWFTERAVKACLDGIVCSPKEIAIVKKVIGLAKFDIVTPNIRPAFLPVTNDDQNPDRARGIAEALGMGATHLVLGRPILQAPDPREAVQKIIAEIESALR